METFFALFGKVVLVLALLSGVAYGAYSLGKTTAVPVREFGAAETTAAPTLPPASPTSGQAPVIVAAGLDASSGLSFTKYQMTVPEGWVVGHTTTNEGTWVDTLTITKGTAQLKIFQAATGGAICLYPTDTPMEGPSSNYDTFVEITTKDGELMRRSTTSGSKGFTVCMKSSYGNFQQPTIFGHMSISTQDVALLSEVDAMITSLKKR